MSVATGSDRVFTTSQYVSKWNIPLKYGGVLGVAYDFNIAPDEQFQYQVSSDFVKNTIWDRDY
jgi:hypothetical protein